MYSFFSGKRHFRQWLVHPLRRAADIESRLDAVEELQGNPNAGNSKTNPNDTGMRCILNCIFADAIRICLTRCADLERLISYFHSSPSKVQATSFVQVLKGFHSLWVQWESFRFCIFTPSSFLQATGSICERIVQELVSNKPVDRGWGRRRVSRFGYGVGILGESFRLDTSYR